MRAAVWALALACLGAAVVLGVTLGMDTDTIFPGVSVMKSDLSGLTRDMAARRLAAEEKDLVQAVPVVLRYNNRTWKINPVSIGVIIDRDRVLQEAMMVGRRGSLIARWGQRRQAAGEGVGVPLYVKLDKIRLEKEISRLAGDIAVPPRDAQLRINPDETVEVIPSLDGVAVDTEKACLDIIEAFKDYRQAPAVDLSTIRVPPGKTTRQMADMGVNGLLATYSSTFDSRDEGRSYNIRVAAEALDGQFIPPSREFSFNGAVGPRAAETGFKNAKIIVNDEFVDGPGGGVCQVSSTLYNTVLLANLEITERRNHSLPVYYVLPGRDATVSYDYLDFRFKNNQPSHIYIKAMVNSEVLTVKIYGNLSQRREVLIKTRVVESIPFKIVYKKDPALGEGEVVLKTKGVAGQRVEADRVVMGDGPVRVEKLPDSLYRPVDQVVLTGPGVEPENASY